MSILTAIFQAIGQALAWVLPISESGHSAIFHNFSGRLTNACSQLTGVIHIGIAIGIFVAFFKFFITIFKSFFGGVGELFHRNLDIKKPTPARRFVFMTILSFAVLILYVIPTGKYGNLFLLLHSNTYSYSLFSVGLCFALTGLIMIIAVMRMNIRVKQPPDAVQALVIGLVAMLAIPTGGCSLIAGVFCACIFMGMNRGVALKYALVMSFMVLLTGGVTELFIAVTKVSVVGAIIALVLSAAVAFVAARVLNNIIKKGWLNYVAYYDITIGLICIVIGIFQTVMK